VTGSADDAVVGRRIQAHARGALTLEYRHRHKGPPAQRAGPQPGAALQPMYGSPPGHRSTGHTNVAGVSPPSAGAVISTCRSPAITRQLLRCHPACAPWADGPARLRRGGAGRGAAGVAGGV